MALLLNLGDYSLQRSLPEAGVDSEVVFESLRSQLMVRTAGKGTTTGPHFHTVAASGLVRPGRMLSLAEITGDQARNHASAH